MDDKQVVFYDHYADGAQAPAESITRRDYFAAAVLQSLLPHESRNYEGWAADLVASVVNIADALIAELDKKKEQP